MFFLLRGNRFRRGSSHVDGPGCLPFCKVLDRYAASIEGHRDVYQRQFCPRVSFLSVLSLTLILLAAAESSADQVIFYPTGLVTRSGNTTTLVPGVDR